MKVVRLSALCTGHVNSQSSIPGTPFCERLSQLQGCSVAGRFMSATNSNYTVGNQTHNLLAFSAVPLPIAPSHVPKIISM